MVQKRYTEYGSNLTANQIAQTNKAMFAPNVLDGGRASVLQSDTVRIEALTLISPDGLIITDEQKDLVFDLSSSAENYTVVMKHENAQVTGGNLATFETLSGIFGQSELTESVVLLWLVYPGSNVNLDDSMIYQPRTSQVVEGSNSIQACSTMATPFSTKWLEVGTLVPPNITITDEYIGGADGSRTKFYNGTSIVKSEAKTFPFVAGIYPPASITINALVDFQAVLTAYITDETGVDRIPTNNSISDTGGVFQDFVMQLPNVNGLDVLKPGTTYHLTIEIQLNPSKQILLNNIRISDYNLLKE